MPKDCGRYWAKVDELKDEISTLKDRIGDLKSIPPSPSLQERIANLESNKNKLDRKLKEAHDVATQCEEAQWIDDKFEDH